MIAWGGVMIRNFSWQTFASEFEFHGVLYSYGLVPHLSKKLRKLLMYLFICCQLHSVRNHYFFKFYLECTWGWVVWGWIWILNFVLKSKRGQSNIFGYNHISLQSRPWIFFFGFVYITLACNFHSWNVTCKAVFTSWPWCKDY